MEESPLRYYRRHRRKKRMDPLAVLFKLAIVATFVRAYASLIVPAAIIAVSAWLVFNFVKVYLARGADIPDIDQMDPIQFEHFIGELFRRKGYQVQVTKPTGDFGADVIARRPGGNSIAIQVKHSSAMHSIGPKAIQEVSASMRYYHCNKAMVVTNSRYTSGASALAKSNHIELWARDRLAREVRSLRGSRLPALGPALSLSMGLGGKHLQKMCPRCGKALTSRSGPYGEFIGCTGFPDCRYKRNIDH